MQTLDSSMRHRIQYINTTVPIVGKRCRHHDSDLPGSGTVMAHVLQQSSHTQSFTRSWKPTPPWLDHKHIGSQVLEHVSCMVSNLWKRIFDSTGFHVLEEIRLYTHVHV